VRQESDRHAEALDAITRFLELGSYREWDEEKKIAWLESELLSKRPLIPTNDVLFPDPATRNANVCEVLDVFHMLAKLPTECMGAYCISMSHYASDVLAVRLLQEKCGVKSPMRVAPLFETRDDLLNAPHHHAGAAHGGLGLEAAHIVKLGNHPVGGLKTQTQEVGRLQGQKQDGDSTDQHKQANPDIIFGALHAASF
jgi:hypothetical protein